MSSTIKQVFFPLNLVKDVYRIIFIFVNKRLPRGLTERAYFHRLSFFKLNESSK